MSKFESAPMPKPVINLDELTLVHTADGPFEETYGPISERIGAKRLGYSVTTVPPGKKSCPFHNHQVGEEMFFILEGSGTLRFGDRTLPLRKYDVIACPPGAREVAHQIINTSDADLKYFCLGTQDEHEVCEYPDSDKVGVFIGTPGIRRMRALFKAKSAVDYMDGERTGDKV